MTQQDSSFARIGNVIYWALGVFLALAIYVGSLHPNASPHGAIIMCAILIWGGAGRIVETARLRKLRLSLAEKALQDPGTGALSTAGLVSAIEREMRLAKRKGTPLSLVMIEARNIMAINREFDRAEGDGALAAVAMATQKCLRDTDYLGRSGGLIFCAILPDTDEGSANVVMARIESSLAAILRSHAKGEVRVRCSLASQTWTTEEDAAAFLAHAHAGLPI